MRTSTLFKPKNFGFFENFGMSARTKGRGVEPVPTFFEQGVGQFFAILCGCLLRTAPKGDYLIIKLLRNKC